MDITCPECQGPIEFAAAFNTAFCWASDAVAFACPNCGKPSYFAPTGEHIEVGLLGAGPALDPIPGVLHPTQVAISRQGQTATIFWQGLSRQLPSAGAYLSSRPNARKL